MSIIHTAKPIVPLRSGWLEHEGGEDGAAAPSGKVQEVAKCAKILYFDQKLFPTFNKL
jgi:hypothetical protein